MKTGRLEVSASPSVSHLPRARGSHRSLLTPHPVSALPCAALMEQQGLGEQDKRGPKLGLSVIWSHQGGEEQHPWPLGEGRRVRVSEGGPHNSISCLLAPSPCSLQKLMLGRTLGLRRPPSTTFISCSLTFLSGQVKTPLTRAQESRAASASAKTGIEPSAPAFPFWHLLQTG